MTRTAQTALAALAISLIAVSANADTISGKVVDTAGKPMEGVMISAFTVESGKRKSVSVFSQNDGSFSIEGLFYENYYKVRARLMGQVDSVKRDVNVGESKLSFSMKPATGEDLEDQRTADSGFDMLQWTSKKDKENYKMMCSYCHQTGSKGWRSPELPVDWDTMIRRMDGFGGLYRHTQKTLVKRLVETYSDKAVAQWPAFVPPPAPRGLETKARITEWDMGNKFKVMVHDLELGPDGLVYAVDMHQNAVVSLDPKNGKREVYRFPGKYRGPHSIELANDGSMWVALCKSGEMGRFDLKTKEFTIVSSAESHQKRGS